jgi:hypothetical protein
VQQAFGDFGLELRQFQHLVAQRPRVVATQRLATAAALDGLQKNHGAIGWKQGPLLPRVPGLASKGSA